MTKNSTTTTPVASEILNMVTPEQVSDAIKAAGCAVTSTEQEGVTWLHSASHGIGFQVLWGGTNVPGQYSDFTLSCPLRIQGGTLPANVLGEWHRTKRFARVAVHGDFVVLEMDVMVAGGISPSYLNVAIQVWTQMMGQFFVFLRNYKPESEAMPTDVATAKMSEQGLEQSESVASAT